MYLTKHLSADGPRWALDGGLLPPHVGLDLLLERPKSALHDFLGSLPRGAAPAGRLLAPIDPMTEVWAAGVTYLRSRAAREAESTVKDVYARVYEADRPELFWKAIGWRAVGHQMPIRVRDDSRWSVPEPELTVVVNSRLEIVGYMRRQRRVVPRPRGREPALPAAGEGLRRIRAPWAPAFSSARPKSCATSPFTSPSPAPATWSFRATRARR